MIAIAQYMIIIVQYDHHRPIYDHHHNIVQYMITLPILKLIRSARDSGHEPIIFKSEAIIVLKWPLLTLIYRSTTKQSTESVLQTLSSTLYRLYSQVNF